MYSYNRTAVLGENRIKDMFEWATKKALAPGWGVSMTNFVAKETEDEQRFEAWISVSHDVKRPLHGPAEIAPSFKFYLTLPQVFSGTGHLMATMTLLHGTDRVLDKEVHTIPQVSDAVVEVIRKHGYETLTY